MNAISVGGIFRRGVTILIAILIPALIYIRQGIEPLDVNLNFGFQEDLIPRSKEKINCEPVADKIVFLKTHKTASSTVQNVLFRWAAKHGKRFALPKSGKSIFKYWKSFKKEEVHGLCPSCQQPDIIAHHMRYSPDVEEIFGQDSYHLSIVRNPVTMFESLFNYMKNVAPQFKAPGSLAKFFEDPEEYSKKTKAMTGFFSRNHLTFQFGLDPSEEIQHKIDENIQRLSKKWDLIMITEYMAESLAVLKYDFCLTIEDIACFITNARPHTTSMSSDVERKLINWNNADVRLYDFFNATLWARISQIGESRIAHDVRRMRKLIENLTDKCVLGYFENNQLEPDFRVYQPPGITVKGIKLTKEGKEDPLCYEMAKPELPWTRELMVSQGIPIDRLEKWN